MSCPKFLFIRHGEAKHNVAFHEVGDAAFTDRANKDAPLTQKGITQAREAGAALRDLNVIDMWSSPLTRCIQTGEELFEEMNVHHLYLHDNLLERLGGGHVCNERLSKSELKKKFPIWKNLYLPELPAWWAERENEYALRQRMFMFIKLLQDLYKDESEDAHVVIVSHADAIRALTGVSLKNAEHCVKTLEEICE